jgi:hypothetical protein
MGTAMVKRTMLVVTMMSLKTHCPVVRDPLVAPSTQNEPFPQHITGTGPVGSLMTHDPIIAVARWRHRWPGLAALVALVVVFGVTVWYSYSREVKPSTSVTFNFDNAWRTPHMVSGLAGRAAL